MGFHKVNGAFAYRSALQALKHEFPGNVVGLKELNVPEMLNSNISNIVKAVALFAMHMDLTTKFISLRLGTHNQQRFGDRTLTITTQAQAALATPS